MKGKGKAYPTNWGDRTKSAMGANTTNTNKQDSNQQNGRPAWLNMVKIKRYPKFTRFMQVCPNGECWYECFLNSEIDAEMKKRGKK